MSLVLDALKKADAERERERSAVPDLHARPLPLEQAPPERRGAALAWGVAAVAAGVAGVLGWQLLRPSPTAAVVPAVQAPAPAAQPARAQAPTPMPTPVPAPAPAPAPPPVAAARPAPAPPAPAPVPARVASPEPTPAPVAPRSTVAAPAPSVAQANRPARTPSTPAPAPATTQAAAGDAERIYDDVQALPEDVRRSVPRLSIGGAMYSEAAANRMLIINGQLFRENDRLADDLVLEQIALKSAVLRYRNYRFRIRY